MKRKMVISIFLVLVIAAAGIVIGVKLFYHIPELSMTDITFMPEDPIVNVDTETFNAKIQNTGKAEAGSFDICLFDNGKLIDSKVIDGLDKEKFVDITFNYIFSTIGHHTVDLVVDCNGKIREKINNKVTFDIEVKEAPVSETSLNPSQAPPTITSTIFKKQLGSDWFASNYGGSSPVIHNGKIYVGGKNQYFFCLNENTGAEIWKYEVKSAGLHPGIYSEPVFYNGSVYFGSTGSNLIESGGHVFALNAENGSLVWEYKTDSDVYSVALDNGIIYELQSGKIYSLDASLGKLIKEYKIPENTGITSSVVVSSNKIFVTGDIPKTMLYCLDIETGNILWTFEGEKYKISPPIVYDGKVYLDGRYCLDAEKGFLIWENKEVSRGSQALGKDLFVATVDGKFLCINAANGQTIWKHAIEPSVSAPFISNEKIYIGTTTNKVHCLRENTGDTIAIYKTNDVITVRPLVYDEKLYIVADDGYLYCFEEK